MSPIVGSLANGSAQGYGGLKSFAPATAFESIATVTGTGSSGTITFSSIPSTYKSLQLRIFARTTSSTDTALNMTFNSDSGSNYTLHRLLGNGSSALSYGFTASSGNQPYGWSQGTANIGGTTIIDIIDYANTSKYKTVRLISGWDTNGSGIIEMQSSAWLNTNAISSITFTNGSSANWATNTSFALYGIN